MTDFLTNSHFGGLIIGVCTFLIIGLFHPLVIKGEYYFGKRCGRWFGIAGIVFLVACLAVGNLFWSSLLGVTAFSCFWSIGEINHQEERVRKGWFPRNPKRRYPWDTQADSSSESKRGGDREK